MNGIPLRAGKAEFNPNNLDFVFDDDGECPSFIYNIKKINASPSIYNCPLFRKQMSVLVAVVVAFVTQLLLLLLLLLLKMLYL